MIWAVIWYWLLAVFTVSDIITTHIVLANGGYEANPFLAPVINHLIIIKLVYMLLMVMVVYAVEKRCSGCGWIPVCGATVITSTAVISNIWQIGLAIY